MLWLQVCTTAPGFCGTGDWTQGLVHARMALRQLSGSPWSFAWFHLVLCVLSERQHGITSDTCHQGKILNSLSVKGRNHFPLMVPSSVKYQRKTFAYGDHMRRINAGKCERNDLSAWIQTDTSKKFEENLMKPSILHSSDCLFGIYGKPMNWAWSKQLP